MLSTYPCVPFALIPALEKIAFSSENVARCFKNSTSNGVFLFVCFHFYVSGSLKEAVKVWNFLSLLCPPGRGPSSRLTCLFLPPGLPQLLHAGGVSASPCLRVSLNPVLPFQRPSLACSGLPRGLAPPDCPRLLTLTASLLPLVDVLGANSQLDVPQGAPGHRLAASSTQSQVPWPSPRAGFPTRLRSRGQTEYGEF